MDESVNFGNFRFGQFNLYGRHTFTSFGSIRNQSKQAITRGIYKNLGYGQSTDSEYLSVGWGSKMAFGGKATNKIKITCPSELYDKIIELIDKTGEFTDRSDYAVAAARFLLNDMYTVIVPHIIGTCSLSQPQPPDMIIVQKVKPISRYGGSSVSFQATMPIGIMQAYTRAVFCLHNSIKEPELYRFALEYYYEYMQRRLDQSKQYVSAVITPSEIPLFEYKPAIALFEVRK